jgi:conjugal transfer pilus assembly protein TraD
MNQSPRRPPYWTIPAFVALMVAPSPATIAIVAAVSVSAFLLRTGRIGRVFRRSATTPADHMLLGRDRQGKPVHLGDQQLSAHGLILGASGAGKSTTLLAILGNQIKRGRPAMAIDLKGSTAFAHELKAAADAAGRPFRIWTLDGPSLWNPLQHGNASQLKDKLIATERFSEPHYKKAAERYMQVAIRVLQAARPGEPIDLDRLVAAMDPRRLGTFGRSLGPENAERLHDYLAGLTPDQLSAVKGIGTRLALIAESDAGQFLSDRGVDALASHPIDLRSALRGDEVVLFSLNASSYPQLAPQIATLAIQDLISTMGDRFDSTGDGRPRSSAIIGIDEFSAIGMDNVLHLAARGREAGLPILLATQEMTDLDRAARGLSEQLTGIVALKIIHRQENPRSADLIAQMAGTERVWDETRHFRGGVLSGLEPRHGTRRLVERFRVHPNEIKELRTGEAIVISSLPERTIMRVVVERQQPGTAHRVSAPQQPAPPAPARRETRPRAPLPARAQPRQLGQGPRRDAPSRGERRGPELG